MIYLDNASTTKPCAEAIEAVTNVLSNTFGNPSSLHRLGVEAEKVVTEARKSLAAALVCEPDCIYFTSGATESNNTAILGVATNYGKRRKKIITTTIEHPSVAETVTRLENQGFEVVRIAPDEQGEITPEAILSQVDDKTCLVTCMLVNNENGYILPVRKVFSEIKRNYPEVITHCDAVQGFMKVPFKAKLLGADIISVSGHKINGPKGIGALYIKKGVRVSPLITGGGQERKQRSGTESVPLIAGFGASVRKRMSDLTDRFEYCETVKAYFLERIQENKNIVSLCPQNSSPYIISIAVPGVKSETMLHFLESKDIFVSSGSACSKGAKSKVMAQFNTADKYLDFVLRLSISHETTTKDIDEVIEAINQGCQSLIHVNIMSL